MPTDPITSPAPVLPPRKALRRTALIAVVAAAGLLGACGSDDDAPAPTTSIMPGSPQDGSGGDQEGESDGNSGDEQNTDSSDGETDAGIDGSGNPNTGGGPSEEDGSSG